MRPNWMNKVNELITDGTPINDLINIMQQMHSGIDVIAIIATMQEIERYTEYQSISDHKTSIHKIEMARMHRLSRMVTPYKNSEFYDS